MLVNETLKDYGFRGFVEDVGLARHPHPRAHRAEVAVHARRAAPSSPSRARSSGATRCWRPPRGGRKSATACSSTTTRTPATAPSPAPTRCARPPTPASRAPIEWDEVPDCQLARLHDRDGPARLRQARRPARRRSTTSTTRSSRCWSSCATREAEGLGEAPLPPQFPKQKGEPLRVQPSRARDEGLSVEIREVEPADWEAIWPFFREIVDAGETYAYDPGSTEAARGRSGSRSRRTARWSPSTSRPRARHRDHAPRTAAAGAPRRERELHGRPRRAGRGVGRALGEHVLDWARAAGFRAMQFNAVVETNERAVALWRSLGFAVVGTVPEAFRLPDGRVRRPARDAPRARPPAGSLPSQSRGGQSYSSRRPSRVIQRRPMMAAPSRRSSRSTRGRRLANCALRRAGRSVRLPGHRRASRRSSPGHRQVASRPARCEIVGDHEPVAGAVGQLRIRRFTTSIATSSAGDRDHHRGVEPPARHANGSRR